MDDSKLPDKLREMRDTVSIEETGPRYTSTITDYDAFASLGIKNEHSISNFLKNFSIKIQSIDPKENSMVVDIIGVDTAIANALRRILLSEVPTVAIEEVTFIQNTSVLQDEVLAHRLGLLPLQIDPTIWPSVSDKYMDNTNTLIFKLHVTCQKADDYDPSYPLTEQYTKPIVYSSDLEWVPQDGQEEYLKKKGFGKHLPLKCVHDDIVVAQLRPGQCVEAWMKCVKGIGRKHAKFSPVGTAFYRLLPSIEVDEVRSVSDARKIAEICPKNVFDVEDMGNQPILKVARPRDCSMCRACISSEVSNFAKVKLSRVKTHFIFEIESIGQYQVQDLLNEAIKVLVQKCQTLVKEINAMKAREEGDDQLSDDAMENID